MHTNSDEKVFYMKNHLLEKLHPNLTGGNPVKHFQNPQKPNRKKDMGLSRSRGKKIQKKLVLNFFEFFFKKWYVIWPGSFKYFSKFHHSHEHEQSPRCQQGIIGLIC